MKIKKILNKINYSLVEKKLEKKFYYQIESKLIIKALQITIPTVDEKIAIFIDNFPKAVKKNIQLIKISKTLSKQINNIYTNKIIGPMELQIYKNENFLAKNATKKFKKSEVIWFINLKNFDLELTQNDYLFWKYDILNQKSTLKTEILVALYLLPLSQYFNCFFYNLNNK